MEFEYSQLAMRREQNCVSMGKDHNSIGQISVNEILEGIELKAFLRICLHLPGAD